MPIIRHGYATTRRNGSTRAHRKARAAVLAAETTCALCGEGDRPNDPWEAHHHLIPAGLGGPSQPWNLRKTHRSCNRKQGMA